MNHRIYLSLGSNVAKEANLPVAVAELAVWGELQAVSAAYETVPVGTSCGTDYGAGYATGATGATGTTGATDTTGTTDTGGAASASGTFLNAAVLLVADLEPEIAKRKMIAAVERKLQRVRDRRDRFAPRTIDIDISLWDNEVLTILGRPVPEPDILRYLHVAQPLADIAPDYVHPLEGRTLADIVGGLVRDALARGVPLPIRRPDVILLP